MTAEGHLLRKCPMRHPVRDFTVAPASGKLQFGKMIMRRRKLDEIQTELPRYIDVTGIVFESSMLNMLHKFQVEAFPYEHQ